MKAPLEMTGFALNESRIQGLGQRTPVQNDGQETAANFEALLIRKVVESMRKMVPEGGLGMSGRQMHDYLVEESLTQSLKDGGGMGMSNLFESSIAPQTPGALSGIGADLKGSGMKDFSGIGGGSKGSGMQALSLSGGTHAPTPSLSNTMPPTSDSWLEQPDAETHLRELMLGGPGGTQSSSQESSMGPGEGAALSEVAHTSKETGGFSSKSLGEQMPPTSDSWLNDERQARNTLEMILQGGIER